MTEITCNLCGYTKNQEVFNSNSYRVVICPKCTLMYLSPRMDQDQYNCYYVNEYQKNRHNTNTYDQAVLRLERKNSYQKKKEQLSFIEEFIDRKSKVIEFGSGWGTLLKVISDQYGASVKGLEISSLAVEVSRKYYNIETDNRSLEVFLAGPIAPEDRYDVVIMYHVLEHLLDPSKILTDIKKILKKNGLLYIGVPNVADPDEDISKFFRIEHCYYFTLQTLKRILEKSGFRLVKVKKSPTDIQVIATPINMESEKKPELLIPSYSVGHLKRVIKLNRFKEFIKILLRPVNTSR